MLMQARDVSWEESAKHKAFDKHASKLDVMNWTPWLRSSEVIKALVRANVETAQWNPKHIKRYKEKGAASRTSVVLARKAFSKQARKAVEAVDDDFEDGE